MNLVDFKKLKFFEVPNRYFPSLVKNEKGRYPDVGEIIQAGRGRELLFVKDEVKSQEDIGVISDEFIRMVEEKNYSMFRQLEESEFVSGLDQLRSDRGKKVDNHAHGETLIWFKKA